MERRLQDPDSDATAVTTVLRRALQVRRDQPALHPDAELQVLSVGRADLVILRRRGQGQVLLAVHNITASRLTLALGRLGRGLWSRLGRLPQRTVRDRCTLAASVGALCRALVDSVMTGPRRGGW